MAAPLLAVARIRAITARRPQAAAKSAREKIANGRRDLRGVGLQRKMPCIEEADDGMRHVALERLGAGRQEERIVLAPYREERRFMRAEILLEGGIERDIALVVAEQV